MKRGDIWNWACVTSAILVLGVHSTKLFHLITIEEMGGHISKGVSALEIVVFLILGAPVALAITGFLSLILNSRKPLIGAVIATMIYLPMVAISGYMGGLSMLILGIPLQYGIFLLPIGVLIWGFMRIPKNDQEQFQQRLPPLPRAPTGHSEGDG